MLAKSHESQRHYGYRLLCWYRLHMGFKTKDGIRIDGFTSECYVDTFSAGVYRMAIGYTLQDLD